MTILERLAYVADALRARAVFGVAGLALCLGATATSAPTQGSGWSEPVTIAPAASDLAIGSPMVSVNARGDALALWNVLAPSGWSVASAERRAGGGWTRSQALPAFPLALALDERGGATAVWAKAITDAKSRLAVSYRRTGGIWQRGSQALIVPAPASSVRASIDANGRPTVVWTTGRPGATDSLVRRAERRADRAWTRPRTVSAGWDPTIAVAPNGEAVIAWSQACEQVSSPSSCIASGVVVRASVRTAERGWSPPTTLSSPGEEGRFPTARINARGTALVVWQSFRCEPGTRLVRIVRSVIGSTRGRFGRPQPLFPDEASTSVALAPTGEAVVVISSEDRVYAATRPPRGGFGTASLIGTGFEPVVSVDSRGNAFAAWTRPSGPSIPGDSELFVHAARRPAGGAFSAGADLAPAGRDCTRHRGCDTDVVLAATPRGAAVAVWRAHTGSGGLFGETSLRAASYRNP